MVGIASNGAAQFPVGTVMIIEGMFLRGMATYSAFVDALTDVVGSGTSKPMLAFFVPPLIMFVVIS